MCWIRARKPEQIIERKKAILKAAAELFAHSDYGKVSLNAIARKAGFTKSNVYRYFKTREEIFLQLFLDSMAEWTTHLTEALKRLPAHPNADTISRTWIEVTLCHKRFLDLIPLLTLSMERNSSEEELIRFKRATHQLMNQASEVIRNCIPGISDKNIYYLLIYFHGLTAGLWPVSQSNETLKRVMSRPEFSSMCIDIEEVLIRGLRIIITSFIEDTFKE